jgi:hypothetical protein
MSEHRVKSSMNVNVHWKEREKKKEEKKRAKYGGFV